MCVYVCVCVCVCGGGGYNEKFKQVAPERVREGQEERERRAKKTEINRQRDM